jgi:hypothetical protein
MPSTVVTGIASFVSATTLLLIVIVWQHPMTHPLVVKLIVPETATEPDNRSAGTTFSPESIINYGIFSTLYRNTTIKRSQISESNGTWVQRNKIKQVMILPFRVKEVVLQKL